jgi:hypothetical protein
MQTCADVWLRNARCRGVSYRNATRAIWACMTCRLVDFDDSIQAAQSPPHRYLALLHERNLRGWLRYT